MQLLYHFRLVFATPSAFFDFAQSRASTAHRQNPTLVSPKNGETRVGHPRTQCGANVVIIWAMTPRVKREEWLQDIEARQRNVVFPDTVNNEARFWRNIIEGKKKLSTVR
jgi:hypothetical protein